MSYQNQWQLNCSQIWHKLNNFFIYQASLTSDSKITLKFGLWFSYICTSHDHDHDHDHDHGRDHDHDHGRTDKHGHSSEQQRPYHKKCRCVKMPSECFFEIHSIVEPSTFVEMKGHEDKTSTYSFAKRDPTLLFVEKKRGTNVFVLHLKSDM